MTASRRRPDAWRAAPSKPSPPRTRPTANAGDSELPVLARLVAPAAAAGGLEKLSPSTCVGTVVVVVCCVAVPEIVGAVGFAVVVVVPVCTVVAGAAGAVVVTSGHNSIQMTLCLSPPGRCTVME